LKSTYFYFRDKKEGMMDKYNKMNERLENIQQNLSM
jgi:hypothetical protein